MKIEVKICGLCREDDAKMAADLGADYLGFVMYDKSPRCVSRELARRIRDALPDAVRTVGVFVNQTPDAVAQAARDCGFAIVQIHGDEAPDGFDFDSLEVWRAVRLEDDTCIPEIASWPAQRYVVDAAPPGQYGGSGQLADWGPAGVLAGQTPVMLAGGLHAGNVADAIRSVHPLGVDVSSGVETEPGVKDPRALEQFIRAARSENVPA